MTVRRLLDIRLERQQLARQRFTRPDQVVAWLGAVQSQDFTAAKWAVGLRLRKATDAGVERAFADGTLLRTHVLRPTWHFVTPADIRWMLALTAPRLRRIMGYYLRQHGVGEAILRRCLAVFERSLFGGRYLTRTELGDALVRARVGSRDRLLTNHVMGHLLGWAEIEGLVCSGPRRGKQFTYALLDERVPPVPSLSREEALSQLARRYFTSHGPASMEDFVWWSGLTLKDARTGTTLAGAALSRLDVDGRQYWSAAGATRASVTVMPSDRRPRDSIRGQGRKSAPDPGRSVMDPRRSALAQLLPNYDEYIVAYADRAALMDEAIASRFRAKSSVLFAHTIVLGGQIVGTWTRSYKQSTVDVALHPLRTLNRTERESIDRALERFKRFVAPLAVRMAGPTIRPSR